MRLTLRQRLTRFWWRHTNFRCWATRRLPASGEVPDAAQIAKLARSHEGVRLLIPRAMPPELQQQSERLLREALPDFEVRLSDGGVGPPYLGVWRVISRAAVLDNADAFVDAAQQFRAAASTGMAHLADHLEVEIEALHRFHFSEMCTADGSEVPQYGDIPGVGHYFFHGTQCNIVLLDGQDVDIELGYGDDSSSEWGALDPWFFARFIHTTPGLAPLARVMPEEFRDACRAMDVLAAHGRLVPAPSDSRFWCGPREPKLMAPRSTAGSA